MYFSLLFFILFCTAAQFEAGEYDAVIKTEEDAVEQGRELRADYKLVAKYVCYIILTGYPNHILKVRLRRAELQKQSLRSNWLSI